MPFESGQFRRGRSEAGPTEQLLWYLNIAGFAPAEPAKTNTRRYKYFFKLDVRKFIVMRFFWKTRRTKLE